SAPKHAGKNEVNPMATFLALEMMLRYLGDRRSDSRFSRQADRLERTIARLLADGSVRTYDQGGTVRTSEAGDRVAAAIRGEAA
ncbi:MAG: isocitrate/isopropylmalate family dehydrogenase, partial [Thermoplasmata archaeon]|nr:isocitrate/isopropylmalate family dehydrogenase [Thermoplasmata archaeon]